MKVIILAGGFGTRLSEETHLIPKPMVEIGGKPMLWHIMKIYSHYGFNEFVILLGYKGHIIKEYFANYLLYQSDVTIDIPQSKIKVHNSASEPWKITLIDTGEDTHTGGRILKAKPYIGDESFLMTYGDGVCDVNLNDLLQFHKNHGKAVSMTVVQPEGKYGKVNLHDTSSSKVIHFNEKPRGDGEDNWINGGFFVCEPKVFTYLEGGDAPFESYPLQNLSNDGELHAFRHDGFWKCMDTQRDKSILNTMWKDSQAHWKVWEA